MLKAGILCTGNELLYGEALDTNSQFFSEKLTEQGIEVFSHLTCSDKLDDLINALEYFHKAKVSLVIINGGLGPTEDDLTREAVSHFSKRSLIQCKESLEKLTNWRHTKNLILSEGQLNQTYFPEGAVHLENTQGTADAWLLTLESMQLLALPGPPHECRPILSDFIDHFLDKPQYTIYKGFYRVMSIPESKLSDQMKIALPDHSNKLRYRAHYPYIDLKFQTHSENESIAIHQKMQDALKTIPHWTEEKTNLERLRNFLERENIDFEQSENYFNRYFFGQLLLSRIAVSDPELIALDIDGLDILWDKQIAQIYYFTLKIKFRDQILHEKISFNGLTRDPFLLATELCAYYLLKLLISFFNHGDNN